MIGTILGHLASRELPARVGFPTPGQARPRVLPAGIPASQTLRMGRLNSLYSTLVFDPTQLDADNDGYGNICDDPNLSTVHRSK